MYFYVILNEKLKCGVFFTWLHPFLISPLILFIMCYSSLPVGGSGDPEGSSAAVQTAAPSASLWFSSSCQMMELESGTFSASGIPDPVTATLAGPGSWT